MLITLNRILFPFGIVSIISLDTIPLLENDQDIGDTAPNVLNKINRKVFLFNNEIMDTIPLGFGVGIISKTLNVCVRSQCHL